MTLQGLQQMETQMQRLRDAGQAYAVATVVRTINATSAKPGQKAILLEDGTLIEGWVGGACARSAVAKATRLAVSTGQPQFISLRPEELLDAQGVSAGQEQDGIRFARNGCPSKGSMDVFIEPVLPQPGLTICGDSPVALALSDLAGRFDLHRTLCAPGLERRDGVVADVVSGDFNVAKRSRFVVIATQGNGDMAALQAALKTQADYIAFVGSRRKFATLADKLTGQGIPAAHLDKIAAPAGLDIHAITPEEIALSILAQITQIRRKRDRNDVED
ncbi:MAG: xanthine dehydrogenase accessory factor [Paracoccaceae bacterium]|jgi:xanthine dehydrogenase accessory factor